MKVLVSAASKRGGFRWAYNAESDKTERGSR
jgi:hypothetical protein